MRPVRKRHRGVEISPPGVQVADVAGKETDEPSFGALSGAGKKGWDIGVDRSAQFTKRTRGDNAHAAVPLEREQRLLIAHHQVVGSTGLRQGEQVIVRRVVGALLYQR